MREGIGLTREEERQTSGTPRTSFHSWRGGVPGGFLGHRGRASSRGHNCDASKNTLIRASHWCGSSGRTVIAGYFVAAKQFACPQLSCKRRLDSGLLVLGSYAPVIFDSWPRHRLLISQEHILSSLDFNSPTGFGERKDRRPAKFFSSDPCSPPVHFGHPLTFSILCTGTTLRNAKDAWPAVSSALFRDALNIVCLYDIPQRALRPIY